MKTDPRLLLLTLVRAQRIFVSVPSFTRSFRNLTSNLPCWWAASWRRWSPKDIRQQVRHWSATDVTSLVQSLLTNSSICFAWTHICIPLPSNQEDLVTTTFQNFDSHFSATRVEVPWQLFSRFMYQIYSDSFHIVLTSTKVMIQASQLLVDRDHDSLSLIPDLCPCSKRIRRNLNHQRRNNPNWDIYLSVTHTSRCHPPSRCPAPSR